MTSLYTVCHDFTIGGCASASIDFMVLFGLLTRHLEADSDVEVNFLETHRMSLYLDHSQGFVIADDSVLPKD